MIRISLGQARGLLLLALLLAWPMAATGHGPKHPVNKGDGPSTEGASRLEAPAQPTAGSAAVEGSASAPPQPETIDPGDWVHEKTGEVVPLDLAFKDERGQTVTLRQLVDRPTLLLPIYYHCPTGCTFELANLAEAIRRSRHGIDDYRAISLSFDADETPAIAAETKPNYTQLLPKGFPSEAWTFLTGEREAIHQLTEAIGYRFKRKDDSTFIHPSALVVLDREGRIIKYIYGTFLAGDVDIALAEAAKQTPATSIRRLLAFCLPSDPRRNQEVLGYIKLAATAALLVGGVSFVFFLRRRKTDQPHFKE